MFIHQSAMWNIPQPVETSWRIMAVRAQMDQVKFQEFILEYLEPMTNSSTTYMLIQSAIEQLPLVVTQCLFHASSTSRSNFALPLAMWDNEIFVYTTPCVGFFPHLPMRATFFAEFSQWIACLVPVIAWLGGQLWINFPSKVLKFFWGQLLMVLKSYDGN